MSFFFAEALETSSKKKTIPLNTARELGCKVCPLKKEALNPDIVPEGSEKPIFYFLGQAPEEADDKENRPFVTEGGRLIRSAIPRKLEDQVRFNNVVRSKTPQGRRPDEVEIECCRKSIIADIERTQPHIIVAVGPVALEWTLQVKDVAKWRGRFVPAKIGNHVCWVYPIYHPNYIIANQRISSNGNTIRTEWDHIFKLDLVNLFDPLLIEEPEYIDHGFLDQIVWSEGLKSDRELEKVLSWIDEMSRSKIVAVDYETNCLRPFEKDSRLLTIAIANDKKSVAFPIEYKEAWNPKQLATLKEALTKFFMSDVKKIAHNVKFEMEWTAHRFGMDTLYTNTWEDTQAQAYVLDERRGMLNLDALIRIHFGFWLKELSNLNRARMESYPLEKILPYNGLDSKWTLRLHHQQIKRVNHEAKIKKMYQFLLDASATLTATQCRGVVLDYNNHAELEKQFKDELLTIEEHIFKLPEVKQFKDRFGMTFNPGSPDHVLRCLKNIVGLDEQLQKDNGKYSTDESILSTLSEIELAKYILDYRGVSKKISTYIEPYPTYVLADGKIHTNFNPYETSTGRLSSGDPNLQNVPNKTGKELRRMIGAPKDHWMVCSDYGQIEARIIGVASQDEAFCEALWKDYDVHMEWAKLIAEEYPKVVGGSQNLNDKAAMKKFRAKVKNLWVFPAFYGASPNSISKGIGVPLDIVQDIFREFWRTFRGVKRWQKWILERYDRLGYVEALNGRRRHAPMSMNAVLNASIQGFASDICVDAMCRLDRLGIQTVMIIHDDVTSYVPDHQLDETLPIIAEEMCKVPFPFINVPIAVEMTAGLNWYDQEEIGTFKSTDFHAVPSQLQDFRTLYDFK